jgi:hypothetical protein
LEPASATATCVAASLSRFAVTVIFSIFTTWSFAGARASRSRRSCPSSHFLAAGDAVQLLVGEFAFVAYGFDSFFDMLVS